eukprot:Rhum_TRINITY_DN25287_c0_g1::Rhum_TRINITY_DN25287_c0_g1_i1::g.181734::m.181734
MSLASQATGDRYNGATLRLDPAAFRNVSAETFSEQLEAALGEWRARRVSGVWLRVPTDLHRFVSPAVELGFAFHHARPTHVMLNAWLKDGESRLPEGASHQIGTGGLVLSPDGEHVLVIQEKTGITAGMKEFWKLPGGLVDRREDVQAGACREVLEETGLKTRFRAIAGFREHHAALFGLSDLYFVCVLQLDEAAYPDAFAGGALPAPAPCEREVAACRWMPVSEFRALPVYNKPGLYSDLICASLDVAKAVHEGEVGASGSGGRGLFHKSLLHPMSKRMESLYMAAHL